MTKDDGGDWLGNFASAETMTIAFLSGNEPQWSVKIDWQPQGIRGISILHQAS